MERDYIITKSNIINDKVKKAHEEYFKKRKGILEIYPEEFFDSMFYSYKAELFQEAKRELILLSEKSTLELNDILNEFHYLVFSKNS